jgi:hypothetical protein
MEDRELEFKENWIRRGNIKSYKGMIGIWLIIKEIRKNMFNALFLNDEGDLFMEKVDKCNMITLIPKQLTT